jgi:hemoglobin-like flavoprotein
MQETRMSTVTNWSGRFEAMVDFVGLSEEDRQLIKDSSPIIMAHARHLTACLYDHFLKYPQARKFFVTEDNEPDKKRIEDNKQTMLSWLRASAAAPTNEGFVRYVVAISQMHMNIPIHRTHLSPVAPRYIIGAISYYQTAIADLLHQQMSDPEVASRTSMAWNKWLMVGLELLLANYLSHNQEDES